MTIQRQYTLPNCNLVLEGLSADVSDPLSPMSVLMNVECRLPGATDAALTGGREFLDGLVAAINRYAQQLLSGVSRPSMMAGDVPPLVDLKPGDGTYHHLIVRQSGMGQSTQDTDAVAPLDVKLSTVQFYDLMEAIDQLLADNQTLPDLQPQFQAISRKLVKPAEPTAKRAAPAVIGAAALAAASLGFFFLPPPAFEPSRSSPASDSTAETTDRNLPGDDLPHDGDSIPEPEESSPDATTVDMASDDPTASGADSEVAAAGLERLASAPAITDEATLALLRRDLLRQLERSWTEDSAPGDDLTYRVAVSENGDILGYKYQNAIALEEVDITPLPELAFVPVDDRQPVQEPVAQFAVTFTPDRQVEVTQWDGPDEVPDAEATANQTADETSGDGSDGTLPDLESAITDGETIRSLNSTLYDNILAELDPLSANEPLEYQVRVTETGDIVDFEPLNAAAGLLADETPLPDLVASGRRSDPQADYRVVFTEAGVLEVSPWDGWPE